MDKVDTLLPLLDRKYLIDTLGKLIKIPTQVPLGPNTLMEPDDPKLIHYVQEVIRPELQRIGAYDIIEVPRNQLVVMWGDGTAEESLLIMVYTPTQHANLMNDPFTGKIGIPQGTQDAGPSIFGQGVSQNKAHMAVMLTILKLLSEEQVRLKGTLCFAVNNEGRSSHDCTEAILSALKTTPGQAILLIGTGMRASIGNRGRVDIYVHVEGKATHSSNPKAGLSAIDGAYEVMKRLRSIQLNEVHPLLGKQHLVVYQITYDPVAPHTLPARATLKLDRRLLPGEDTDAAVETIRAVLHDMKPYTVTVERGVCMLPSLTEENAQIVQQLLHAARVTCKREVPVYYSTSTFDAGGLTSQGIPAVMFGAEGESEGILGEDYVTIRDLVDEARILLRVILNVLSG